MHTLTSTAYSGNKINLKVWWALIFFTAAVVMTGIIAANVPLYDDDLVFANAWGCSIHQICPEENFDPWGYALEHRMLTNGRVGDMFTPLFTMLPRWLYGTLYSLCYGITLLLVMSIARCGLRSTPLKSIWIVAFSVVLFPWIDVFYTRAVFFNYYPAIIFTLLSLRFFISKRRLTGWRLWACVLVGLLTGCWHELMPVVLFPAAVVYCIVTRKVTRNQWIVSIPIAVGVAFVVSAPSFFNRPDQLPILQFSEKRKLLAYLYTILLIALALISIAMIYLRKGSNKATRKDKALVLSLAMPTLPCCGIMLGSLYETRICFPAIVFSIIAFFYALPQFRLKRLMTVATALVSVVIIVHLLCVAQDSIKVCRASEDIMAQATSDHNATIYYDLADIVANDTYHLYKTQGRSYINKLHSWDEFSDYTGYRYSFNVLPPALKSFDIAEADTIDSRSGVYYYKGCLITDSPCDSTNYIHGIVAAEYSDGNKGVYRFMGPYFKDINGKPLIYILPYHPRMPRKKPTAAKIVEYNLRRRIMR